MAEIKNSKELESVTPEGNEPVDPNVAAFHAYLYTGAYALIKENESYASSNVLNREARETKREKDRDAQNGVADLVMDSIVQRQIDNNMLRLQINGQDIDISQKDLRTVMEDRVRELKERRDAMIKNGASADEIAAMNILIGRYDKTIDDLKNGKADPDTMDDIQGIIADDPDLADDIEDFKNSQNAASSEFTENSRSTSFTAEYFDEDDKPTILTCFNSPANGALQPAEPENTETPAITKLVDNTFDSFGF